ncbi:unnamed protein product [Candidula unifasciata]|uniref:Dol-P-Glc:Glc(2)Man(9)GlcNAc(2)-PP-Dol alpha-1,2-glucosyltransferase n=1 Tax=Candidula unifasciata TaxID=100452 RepID=A0A8S4A941_9EUPU|nr:unnamed protein product [Candidula unifasciata]
MVLVLFLVASVLTLVSYLTLKYVHGVQDAPYMDEIFHIPQAQQYCSYNFSSWDPMITTLPGLYVFSVIQLLPVASFRGARLAELCTTFNLRASNVTYCIGNFILLFVLTRQLTGNAKRTHLLQVLNAAVLTLFPVLYFFTWLYYTDPGATFFVLLMYALCLRGYHKSAAMAGAAAVLFRQTNIIWVLFCTGVVAIEVINERLRLDKKWHGNPNNMSDKDFVEILFQTTFSSCARFFSLVKQILIQTFCYLCIIVGFIVFLVVNKGIVVGDRSHHTASYNFPQVFYFLAVSAGFSFMHLSQPSQVIAFVKSAVKNPIKILLFAVLAGLLIKLFTCEHKYLLSDNRHYTFYVWSKIFKRHQLARYALIPVYFFSLYQFYNLTSHRGFLWRVVFSVCTIACLVPQALLEFRYYIVPFYILRLNMKLPTAKMLIAELFLYVFINSFTVYMFTQKPFVWPEDPSPQRFMW